MPDYLKIYKDPYIFLNDEDARSLTDKYVNIKDLSDKQLMFAILDDILSVTMYEIQFNKYISYGPDEITQYVKDKEDIERIFNLILDSDLTRYLEIKEIKNNMELRIINDRNVLQEVMDKIGVWYTDYDIPYDTYLEETIYDDEDQCEYLY